MINWFLTHVEWFALAVNVSAFIAYLIKGDEIGKTLYWAGTVFVVLGLLRMKG